jgi:hypothetical protein
MSDTSWERETDLTPQPEVPAPRTEENPAPPSGDTGSDWQGYSPEILSTVLDS